MRQPRLRCAVSVQECDCRGPRVDQTAQHVRARILQGDVATYNVRDSVSFCLYARCRERRRHGKKQGCSGGTACFYPPWPRVMSNIFTVRGPKVLSFIDTSWPPLRVERTRRVLVFLPPGWSPSRIGASLSMRPALRRAPAARVFGPDTDDDMLMHLEYGRRATVGLRTKGGTRLVAMSQRKGSRQGSRASQCSHALLLVRHFHCKQARTDILAIYLLQLR